LDLEDKIRHYVERVDQLEGDARVAATHIDDLAEENLNLKEDMKEFGAKVQGDHKSELDRAYAEIKRLRDQLTGANEKLDQLWKRFEALMKDKENTEHEMQLLRVTMSKYESSKRLVRHFFHVC
jgi:chromosome segregation ATPase